MIKHRIQQDCNYTKPYKASGTSVGSEPVFIKNFDALFIMDVGCINFDF